ncbi:MAG: hypothetical protein [Bacteriophage sp.]|nr:MAG: hypothetical protein [Bacteriophage sp.]
MSARTNLYSTIINPREALIYSDIGTTVQAYDATLQAISSLSLSDLLNDMNIKGLNLLGSTIKAQSLGMQNTDQFTNANMVDGTIYWGAMYVPTDCTLSGIRWGQRVQGAYVSDNENRAGIYSISGGTMTQIAATTNDGNLWKGTSQTMQSKAFSATVNVTAGIYFVALLYNTSLQTTAPNLNCLTTVQWLCNGDLSNSVKLFGTTTGTTLPASQAMSGVTGSSTAFYVQAY